MKKFYNFCTEMSFSRFNSKQLFLPFMKMTFLVFIINKTTTTKALCNKQLINKNDISSLSKDKCDTSIISKELNTEQSNNIQPIFRPSKLITIPGVLSYTTDRYDGVIINEEYLPNTLNDFSLILKNSLAYWKSNENRGIWLKIPIIKSEFIKLAIEEGFIFHHAESDYIMLTCWLSDTDENKLPPNASHQVGVGSVVISNNKLLLVQEKNGPLKGTGIWKLPTGLADQGEDISDAAVREVFEETGIETEFIGVICFRQNHNSLFGKSDLFFVCLLKPKTFHITLQPSEIFKCEWIDSEIYFQQSFFKKSGLYNIINEQIRNIIKTSDKINDNRLQNLSIDTNLIEQCNNNKNDNNSSNKANNNNNNNNNSNNKTNDNNSNNIINNPHSMNLMSVTRLPIGFRPGYNSLYHFAIDFKDDSDTKIE